VPSGYESEGRLFESAWGHSRYRTHLRGPGEHPRAHIASGGLTLTALPDDTSNVEVRRLWNQSANPWAAVPSLTSRGGKGLRAAEASSQCRRFRHDDARSDSIDSMRSRGAPKPQVKNPLVRVGGHVQGAARAADSSASRLSWIAGLATSTPPVSSMTLLPSRSVAIPPASRTSTMPAAMSQAPR
jgi:hypothetical protein